MHQKHTACDAMLNFAAILTVYTPERSSVERRRCGEREGAERRDADALAARSASGKEAAEKARKASPVWELRCSPAALLLGPGQLAGALKHIVTSAPAACP